MEDGGLSRTAALALATDEPIVVAGEVIVTHRTAVFDAVAVSSRCARVRGGGGGGGRGGGG
jgi:hypothetical protein